MQLIGRRCVFYLAVVSQALTMVVTSDEFLEEPRCLSMYDFGYKLIRKVVDLEKAQGDMARLVEEQQATIEGLKQQLSPVAEQISTAVVMHAKRPRRLELSIQDRIVFGEVITNLGDGYDEKTGIFRAPVPGSYLLSCVLMTVEESRIGFGFSKNGDMLAATYAGDDNSLNAGTVSVVATLESGDEITVERMSGKGTPLYNSVYGNYFSATLLQRFV